MTRDELNTYPILIMEASWLRDKIQSLREKCDYPRIPQLTGMPGAHQTRPGSAQERVADELMDVLPAYEQRLQEIKDKQHRIEAAVDRLPEKERLVTKLHCMERRTYQAIGEIMHYSASTISAIQMNAYKLLEEEDRHE